MEKVQVEILGISTSPASNGAYALILRETGGSRRIPIIIGAFEAQAIALEMEGIKPPRPFTHDLIKTVIEALGGTVVEASIHDLKEGTFYATLTLAGDIEIDSRPSDAIAVAIRFGIPIFVADHVMTEASFLPEDGDEELEEGEEDDDDKPFSETLPKEKSEPTKLPARPATKMEQLNLALGEAIKREDYEKAASIRDEIQKLSNNG
ncbi:MAG: bifunctional nuclease domain-containing protein [Candidatus Kapaibacterium sp.]|jgi:bifunctional DNase/RNase